MTISLPLASRRSRRDSGGRGGDPSSKTLSGGQPIPRGPQSPRLRGREAGGWGGMRDEPAVEGDGRSRRDSGGREAEQNASDADANFGLPQSPRFRGCEADRL